MGLIFLVGLAGSGKSVVGPLLAAQLGVPFVDTDGEIEHRTGRAIPDIFRNDGEAAFRDLERSVLAESCKMRAAVIATGGGALIDPSNRQAMRTAGCAVWLDAPNDVLLQRVGADPSSTRPLLAHDPATALQHLRASREWAYGQAEFHLDTANRTPGQVAEVICSIVETSARLDPVWVRAPSQTYPVYIGAGLLGEAALLLQGHGLAAPLRVIADAQVAHLHGLQLRATFGPLPQSWYPVPAGEEHKTLDQATQLYGALLADGPERSDVIVAVGGGVIGDLAGFVAATLLRGLRLAQVPTTVLAQVDSSVGGKVGVDHPRGKNLVGAFHHPSLVLADVDLLRTLPAREISAGWAEVAKIAMVQDADLFEELERSADELRALEPERTARIIRRAVALKAQLVERDERDTAGVRAILNYGHTLGHALEAATSYTALLHGEAVGIGMRGAAHIAHRMGLLTREEVERQDRVVKRLGLPTHYGGVSHGALRAALGLDKKRAGGRTKWVLPDGIGAVRTGADVPDALVDEAMKLVTGDRP